MVTKLPAQVTILSAVGSRGLSKREVNRLGSISQEVANQAPCSVLLVR
jgi:nucleotide-binding universal stress UspA family protein